MKNRRPPKSAKAFESRLAVAALDLAGKGGWTAVTHKALASKCGLSVSDIKKMLGEPCDLLPFIVRMIDDEMAKRCGKIDPKDPPKDRLFEALMARFDALQKYRSGVVAIAKVCRHSPGMARFLLGAQLVSMGKVLKIAHLERKNVVDICYSVGLLAIYYNVLRTWAKNADPDMQSVMDYLNRSLFKVERWVF